MKIKATQNVIPYPTQFDFTKHSSLFKPAIQYAQCQISIYTLFANMWKSILSFAILLRGAALAQNTDDQQVSTSACPATYFQLSDPPYENYFVSTCNFAATVVASSPNENSNLTLISPRLIAAFPAGMPSDESN